MTTLLIRYPAKASVDSGAAQTCPFALVGDGGNLLQQGASPLGNLSDMVASARRVVLLLAAADVTLLRVVAPPLSAARLKAALPALVEEQVLGDPADCVLAAGAADAEGGRTVAVVQRSWIEVLVKALLAQGAHNVSVLPAQLCLPFQPGAVSAALSTGDAGFELILRQSQTMGMGLTLPAQPQAALQTLRAMAGDEPVTLYLAPSQMAQFAPLVNEAEINHGITLLEDHWAHWVAASRSAGLDLAPALGASGASARQWQRWRWPLRIAALALLVNVVGLNIEWLRLKREADAVNLGMLQTFKAAYPKELVILQTRPRRCARTSRWPRPTAASRPPMNSTRCAPPSAKRWARCRARTSSPRWSTANARCRSRSSPTPSIPARWRSCAPRWRRTSWTCRKPIRAPGKYVR